jgi:hypothetical protein
VNKRISISKRVRFKIFARDNFTCRYCGKQSDAVPLVIDHMIPVAQGGTNDEENLITACEPCNQGKSDTLIDQHVANEADRLRRAQERNEQMRAAESARAIVEAHREIRQAVIDLWCDVRGQDEMHARTLDVMVSFVGQHGFERVAQWITIAASRLPYKSDYQLGKYISGIRRRQIEEGTISPPGTTL